MDIQNEYKSREAFESLWIQSNGHFKYFVFSQEQGKYIPTGVRDNLTDQELLFASITLNTAYLFFLGGIKTQAVPDGFVLVLKDQAKDTARLDFMLNGNRVVREVTIYNEDHEPIATGSVAHDVYWISGWDRLCESVSDSNRGAIDLAMIEAAEVS